MINCKVIAEVTCTYIFKGIRTELEPVGANSRGTPVLAEANQWEELIGQA